MPVPGRRVERSPMCDICNDHNAAESYCTQCDEFLCISCERAHRGLKATKHHSVLGKDDMPARKLTDGSHCERHGNELFRYFCTDHDTPCCYGCVVEHKTCKLEYIESLSKNYKGSSEYRNLKRQIKILIKSAEKIADLSNQEHELMQNCFEELSVDIQNYGNDLKKILDFAEQNATETVVALMESHTNSKNANAKTMEGIKRELLDINILLEKLERYNLKYHLILTAKRVIPKLKMIEGSINKIKDENRNVRYNFERNADITHFFNDLYSLGDVNDGTSEKVVKKEDNIHSSKVEWSQEIGNPIRKYFFLAVKYFSDVLCLFKVFFSFFLYISLFTPFIKVNINAITLAIAGKAK